MLKINIDDKDVLALLQRLTATGQNLAPAMGAVAGKMLDAAEENFERQGRPAWAPLRKRTIARRSKEGHWPGRMLQVTGQLASSVSTSHDALSATVGSNKVYAGIHQTGGTITQYAHSVVVRHRVDNKGNLLRQKDFKNLAVFAKDHHKRVREKRAVVPEHTIKIAARPFLQMTEEDMGDVEEILLRHIKTASP